MAGSGLLEVTEAFIEFKRTMGTDKKYASSNMGKDYTSEDLSSEVLKKCSIINIIGSLKKIM